MRGVRLDAVESDSPKLFSFTDCQLSSGTCDEYLE